MVKISWSEASLRLNACLTLLSPHLKKILVFNSSPIVVGIVGRLLLSFELISTDFYYKKEFLGSYFKQKFKFVFVYSCPQYTFISDGRTLSLFSEFSISTCVPSNILPHPKENKASPVNIIFSFLK